MTPPPAPTEGWLVDASVALKWFLPVDREPEGKLARAAVGTLAMRTTALAVYEIGNVLIRHSGWTATRAISALELLEEICGDPIELVPDDHRLTVELAIRHKLTFYDASYAAVAFRTGRRLLSADRDLIAPRLAAGLREALPTLSTGLGAGPCD